MCSDVEAGLHNSLKTDEKVVYPQAAPFMLGVKHSKTGSTERQRMNKVLMRILRHLSVTKHRTDISFVRREEKTEERCASRSQMK